MIKAIIEKIKSFIQPGAAFDPAQFNDPVALKTQWVPAKGGGTNFRTHKLVLIDSNRIVVKATAGAVLFYSIFLVVGIALVVGLSASAMIKGTPFREIIMPAFVGLIFALIGGCMFYFGTVPIVFDKQKRLFWKGRKAPDEVFDKSSLKDFAELEDIYALQLVSEYCRGNKSSFYSYELNLVFADGRRMNVIDHGNKDKLREDARVLAEFLEKPLWDAI